MDNGNDNSGGDDSLMVKVHLPVIIPPPQPPAAEPFWRFALPYFQLILVAAIASGVGVLSATLWPYHNALNDVITASLPGPKASLPGPKDVVARTGDKTGHTSLTTIGLNRPAAMIASETCHTRVQSPQLLVSGPTATLRANEPAALGLTVDGAPDDAQLVICGFAAKSIISAGRSIDEKTWTLPASDVGDALLIPPAGFVGAMKLDIVLVNLDKTVFDRKTMLLRWQSEEPAVSAPPAMKYSARSDIDGQLENARRLEAGGNLPLARGIFLRFAQQGNPRAAYLLANTYDPISLAKRQLPPPDSDLALARIWYRKASDWGSQDATARLERLANW